MWQVLPIHRTRMHKDPIFYSPYSSYGIGINPFYTHIDDPSQIPSPSTEFLNLHEDWIEDYAVFIEIAKQYNADDWTTWPAELRSHNADAIDAFKRENINAIDQTIRIQAHVHTLWNRLLAYAHDKNVEIWGDMPYYLPLHGPIVWANQHLFELNEDGSFTFASGVEKGKQHPRQLWKHPLYRWDDRKKDVTDLFKS